MSSSEAKQKELEARLFSPPNEPGPEEGKPVQLTLDADEVGSTLLVRDLPEDEPLTDLQSRLEDFAALRRPLTRVANGDIHAVFYTPKDVQSVLDWYAGRRAPRFMGNRIQLFTLRGAPPKQVWE